MMGRNRAQLPQNVTVYCMSRDKIFWYHLEQPEGIGIYACGSNLSTPKQSEVFEMAFVLYLRSKNKKKN